MSAEDLVRYVTWASLLAISVVVFVNAARRPRRATLDTAFLFGAIAIIIINAIAAEVADTRPEVLELLSPVLLMALPYLVLRLAADFVHVPALVLRLAEAGVAATVVVLIVASRPYATEVVLLVVAYFVVVQSYATWRFVVGARSVAGVVRRRMVAVALGSGFLAFLILVAGASAAFPGAEGIWSALASASTLGVGGAYFLGFATPRFVKRGWQAPELEAFLELVSVVGSEPLPDLVRTLESTIARMLGVPTVTILNWRDGGEPSVARGVRYEGPAPRYDTTVAAESFRRQAPVFVEDAVRTDPDNAEVYRYLGARAVLAAPLSTDDRRLGVIVAYGERASPFAEDDLALLDLLARQVAIVLRNHELVAEQARLRAHEETIRLKDEFLSAAAHELKTPLTTLVGQTQLMQRRAERDPAQPADAVGLGRLAGQARRMRRLVENLMDASLSDHAELVTERTPVDLLDLARGVASGAGVYQHQVQVNGDAVVVPGDRERLAQALENLLDNAVKYSPPGTDIRLDVSADNGNAYLVVGDAGAGIPEEDHDLIFERFQRGSGSVATRMTGLGLGLYLSRRIIEEHGGTIAVSNREGGSDFTVTLPLKHDETEI